MTEFEELHFCLELIDFEKNILYIGKSDFINFVEHATCSFELQSRKQCEPDMGIENAHIKLRCRLTLKREQTRDESIGEHSDDTSFLTKRQAEIVPLLQQGLSNKEIAKSLNISPATAKNHVHAILEKLKLDRRSKVASRVRSRKPMVDPKGTMTGSR